MKNTRATQLHTIGSVRRQARTFRETRCPYVPGGRTLFLVDIENLAAEPRPCLAAAADALGQLAALTPIGPDDHVVIGAHTVLAATVGPWWPQYRIVTGTGPNAADLALIDVVDDSEWIATRYDRIIIGSGDHIFVDTVARLRQFGAVVGVVSRENALSPDLRRVASYVRTWSDDVAKVTELAAAA